MTLLSLAVGELMLAISAIMAVTWQRRMRRRVERMEARLKALEDDVEQLERRP
jgi:uncharacterized membrane protein YqjE